MQADADSPDGYRARALGVPAVAVGTVGSVVIAPGGLPGAGPSGEVQKGLGVGGRPRLEVVATPPLAELLMHEHDDGMWSVLYRGDVPRDHALDVRLGGRRVAGSPFHVRIFAPPGQPGPRSARLSRALADWARAARARGASGPRRARAARLGDAHAQASALDAWRDAAAELSAAARALAFAIRRAALERKARALRAAFSRWPRVGGYGRTLARTRRTHARALFAALAVAARVARLRRVADGVRRRRGLGRIAATVRAGGERWAAVRAAEQLGRARLRRQQLHALRDAAASRARFLDFRRRGHTLRLWEGWCRLGDWVARVARGRQQWPWFAARARGRRTAAAVGALRAHAARARALRAACEERARDGRHRALDALRWRAGKCGAARSAEARVIAEGGAPARRLLALRGARRLGAAHFRARALARWRAASGRAGRHRALAERAARRALQGAWVRFALAAGAASADHRLRAAALESAAAVLARTRVRGRALGCMRGAAEVRARARALDAAADLLARVRECARALRHLHAGERSARARLRSPLLLGCFHRLAHGTRRRARARALWRASWRAWRTAATARALAALGAAAARVRGGGAAQRGAVAQWLAVASARNFERARERRTRWLCTSRALRHAARACAALRAHREAARARASGAARLHRARALRRGALAIRAASERHELRRLLAVRWTVGVRPLVAFRRWIGAQARAHAVRVRAAIAPLLAARRQARRRRHAWRRLAAGRAHRRALAPSVLAAAGAAAARARGGAARAALAALRLAAARGASVRARRTPIQLRVATARTAAKWRALHVLAAAAALERARVAVALLDVAAGARRALHALALHAARAHAEAAATSAAQLPLARALAAGATCALRRWRSRLSVRVTHVPRQLQARLLARTLAAATAAALRAWRASAAAALARSAASACGAGWPPPPPARAAVSRWRARTARRILARALTSLGARVARAAALKRLRVHALSRTGRAASEARAFAAALLIARLGARRGAAGMRRAVGAWLEAVRAGHGGGARARARTALRASRGAAACRRALGLWRDARHERAAWRERRRAAAALRAQLDGRAALNKWRWVAAQAHRDAQSAAAAEALARSASRLHVLPRGGARRTAGAVGHAPAPLRPSDSEPDALAATRRMSFLRNARRLDTARPAVVDCNAG